jgi:hypothetical protein
LDQAIAVAPEEEARRARAQVDEVETRIRGRHDANNAKARARYDWVQNNFDHTPEVLARKVSSWSSGDDALSALANELEQEGDVQRAREREVDARNRLRSPAASGARQAGTANDLIREEARAKADVRKERLALKRLKAANRKKYGPEAMAAAEARLSDYKTAKKSKRLLFLIDNARYLKRRSELQLEVLDERLEAADEAERPTLLAYRRVLEAERREMALELPATQAESQAFDSGTESDARAARKARRKAKKAHNKRSRLRRALRSEYSDIWKVSDDVEQEANYRYHLEYEANK